MVLDIIINELLMKAKAGQPTMQRLIDYEEVNMKRMLIQRIKVLHPSFRTTTSNVWKRPRRNSKHTPHNPLSNALHPRQTTTHSPGGQQA
jgi:hypothetical protein